MTKDFTIDFMIVFAAMLALDFVWAKYTYAMTNLKPILSGLYAAVLIVLSGVAAIGYTQDPWLLVPAMAGAFAGTWLAVLMHKHPDKLRNILHGFNVPGFSGR